MTFLCPCGNKKTGQPYKATGTKPWVCYACRAEYTAAYKRKPVKVLHLVTVSAPGETGRRKGLKIPRLIAVRVRVPRRAPQGRKEP